MNCDTNKLYIEFYKKNKLLVNSYIIIVVGLFPLEIAFFSFLSKAIFKVKNDNFCLEIILLVFPQLVNLDKLNKLTQNQENIIWNKNFIFILRHAFGDFKCTF